MLGTPYLNRYLCNPANTWKIIKSVISTENSIFSDEVVMQNGFPTNKPEEVFYALSQHFANTGVNLSSRTVASHDHPPLEFFFTKAPIDMSMYMKPFSRDEVEKIILGMKSKLASSD